ncbi:AP-1-like transcription factor CAP1 [Smittium culicis]|uniref:AP-1-like transcription factor CAP1 n=1 Tax=Smittium culicis TaxID=133412 RepID=A0A1R1XTC6_9FUNG|nr:AP-1-like transcription factor CAP1 [Smittium culicis]
MSQKRSQLDIHNSSSKEPKLSNDSSNNSKKVGRKPVESESTNKRVAQNRAAQRAFRERKQQHVKLLEKEIDDLKKAKELADKEAESLRIKVDMLIKENNVIKQSLPSSSFNFSTSDIDSSFISKASNTSITNSTSPADIIPSAFTNSSPSALDSNNSLFNNTPNILDNNVCLADPSLKTSLPDTSILINASNLDSPSSKNSNLFSSDIFDSPNTATNSIPSSTPLNLDDFIQSMSKDISIPSSIDNNNLFSSLNAFNIMDFQGSNKVLSNLSPSNNFDTLSNLTSTNSPANFDTFSSDILNLDNFKSTQPSNLPDFNQTFDLKFSQNSIPGSNQGSKQDDLFNYIDSIYSTTSPSINSSHNDNDLSDLTSPFNGSNAFSEFLQNPPSSSSIPSDSPSENVTLHLNDNSNLTNQNSSLKSDELDDLCYLLRQQARCSEELKIFCKEWEVLKKETESSFLTSSLKANSNIPL